MLYQAWFKLFELQKYIATCYIKQRKLMANLNQKETSTHYLKTHLTSVDHSHVAQVLLALFGRPLGESFSLPRACFPPL